MFHRQNHIANAFDRMQAMPRSAAPLAALAVAGQWGGALRDIADSAPRTGNYGQPQMVPPGYGYGGYAPQMMPQQAQVGAVGFPGPLAFAGAPGVLPDGSLGWPCTTGCCEVPQPTTGAPKLVGLPDVCIPGHECGVVIETSVCAPFTVLGLFIPDTIARCLSLTRFRVGCSDLLINCDPIPAELFSCCEIDENMLGGTTVAANSPICLTFDNKCKADVEFEGAVKGIACMACP